MLTSIAKTKNKSLWNPLISRSLYRASCVGRKTKLSPDGAMPLYWNKYNIFVNAEINIPYVRAFALVLLGVPRKLVLQNALDISILKIFSSTNLMRKVSVIKHCEINCKTLVVSRAFEPLIYV